MSWVDDALNTPEAVITDFVKDELPKVRSMVIVWVDSEDAIWYRASSMRNLHLIGLLEAGKSMVKDMMWGDEDTEGME